MNLSVADSSPPRIGVVVPAYNRGDLLARCLQSLKDSQGVDCRIQVIDNASPEDLEPIRAAFPELGWLRRQRNIGYAAANNVGLEGATGDYVCWLNSDAELEPGTLASLVAFLEARPRAGAVTPRNVGPDGETQPSVGPEHTLLMGLLRDSALHLLAPGLRLFRRWQAGDLDLNQTQPVATSQTTCLLVRAAAYASVGPMDESLFLFYNDVDWCRRLRAAGWELWYDADARVVHHGSASVETVGWKERQLWRDRARFYRKHYGRTGSLVVRLSCLSRAAARYASHIATGRLRTAPDVGRLGLSLLRAMDDGRDGQ